MSTSSLPMASTVVDSILFRDAFGTQKMRKIFSDGALVQRYIDAEVALARAEARCGVIPAEAAEVIARESRLDRIDFDHMRHETDIVGYPILPLVHQLVEMCGESGRYVQFVQEENQRHVPRGDRLIPDDRDDPLSRAQRHILRLESLNSVLHADLVKVRTELQVLLAERSNLVTVGGQHE